MNLFTLSDEMILPRKNAENAKRDRFDVWWLLVAAMALAFFDVVGCRTATGWPHGQYLPPDEYGSVNPEGLRALEQFKGKKLWKLPWQDQLRIAALVNEVAKPVWTPVYFTDITEPGAKSSVMVEAGWNELGQVIHFRQFDKGSAGPAWVGDELRCGMKFSSIFCSLIKGIVITNTVHGDVVRLEMTGGVFRYQYYRALGRPVLLRLEDEHSNLVANDYVSHRNTMGSSDWRIGVIDKGIVINFLDTPGYFEQLAMLQWLGGLHLPDDALPRIPESGSQYFWWSSVGEAPCREGVLELRRDQEIRKRLEKFSTSDDRWLREAAQMALERMAQ